MELSPERMVWLVEGMSGAGKSTLAKKITARIGRSTIVYGHRNSRRDAIKIYGDDVELRYITHFGNAESWLQENRGSSVVLEDLGRYPVGHPMLDFTRKNAMGDTRKYDIFFVPVSQSHLSLPEVPRIEVADGTVKIRHGKKTVEGISRDDIELIMQFVLKGLPGLSTGTRGRKIHADSYMQIKFAEFEAGILPAQIVQRDGLKSGTYEYDKLYAYWLRYQRKRGK